MSEADTKQEKSYGQILKSSSLVGGAEAISIVFGIIQTKLAAILIGKVGIGLLGTFTPLLELVVKFAGLGVPGSGVREIAEARGEGDERKAAEAAIVLKRLSWITGAAGALILLLFSAPVSRFTFGTADYQWAVAALSGAVLLRCVRGGQLAFIQGSRRIKDLAKVKIIGAAGGCVLAVGLYFWLGIKGVVPAILALTTLNFLSTWWFTRKQDLPKISLTYRETWTRSRGMITLGLALMWAGLLPAGVAYLTRYLVIREINLEAVGIFHAAYRISGLFAGFVLGAMAMDFYPRLTAASKDNKEVTRLVNEQTEIGLLLSAPGLVGTLSFAPWLIEILYTSEFSQASELLKWFILGCVGMVISWPMGYILLAKKTTKVFTITATTANLLHMLYIYLGIQFLGLAGVSIAYLANYVTYTAVMLIVTRKICGFSWSTSTMKCLGAATLACISVVAASHLLPGLWAYLVCATITCVVSWSSAQGIVRRLGPDNKLSRTLSKIPGISSAK